MKISNSATNRYMQCPKSYELHYIRKLRPNWTSSALIFGDSLDKGLNELLLNTGKDPYEIFLKGWTNALINKKPVYVPTSDRLVYANKDYNPNILTEEDYAEINQRVESGELTSQDITRLIEQKKTKSWDSLSSKEKSYYNFVNWLCMKRKAWFMIESYKKKVMPKITKVHAVQKQIAADNGMGDELTGYIDLIADVEGYGTVILDNKTSAREYAWDSPSKSPQLALYSHMEGPNYNTTKVGFIVMLKELNDNKIKTCKSCGHIGKGSHKTCDNTVNTKRCGGEWVEVTNYEADIQILIQEVSTQFETMTIDNFDEVTNAINNNVFPRNLNSCHNTYGSDCPYLKYCMSGCKNEKGLERPEE